MKKTVLFVLTCLLILAGRAYSAPGFTGEARDYFYAYDFQLGDQVSRPLTYSAGSAMYLAVPTGISGTACIFPSGAGFSTATTTVITPQNLFERPGNVQFYALCHLSSQTTTATMQLQVQQQNYFTFLGAGNSITTSCSAAYLTTTAVTVGSTSAQLPVCAASQLYRLPLPGFGGIEFRKNKFLNLFLVRNDGLSNGANIELLAIEVKYQVNSALGR